MKNNDITILTPPESDGYVNLEEDCACTSDISLSPNRAVFNELIPHNISLIKPSGVIIQSILDEDHELVMNLVGQNQLAILNQPATTLLDHFSTPKPVYSAQRLFPEIAPATLQQHINQLANLNLLQLESVVRFIDSPNPVNQAPQTLTAWLHVTNQCNLRCPYCYIHKTPDKMALQTGEQSIDAVMRSAVAHKIQRVKLKYAGGEATLNFALVAALQTYAEEQASNHHLHMESVVLSNGVVITDRMIDFLQAHRMKLMVSLDGVGEVHNNQRPFINGRGSFRQVEKSLDKLIQRQFLPDISITISNRNLHNLAETVEYVLERDLPFTLNFFRDNECSAGVTDLRYANQQIIEAMMSAFQVIEKHLPRRSLLNAIVDRANLQQAHTRTCGVGQNYLVINQHGGVAKCHMEIEKPITTVQAEDPLLLVNQDQTGIQNLHVEEKEGCRDCDWRHWCAGGCPLLTYRATGRYDVKSPNCNIYKAIFPEVLRLEGLRILKYYGPKSDIRAN